MDEKEKWLKGWQLIASSILLSAWMAFEFWSFKDQERREQDRHEERMEILRHQQRLDEAQFLIECTYETMDAKLCRRMSENRAKLNEFLDGLSGEHC